MVIFSLFSVLAEEYFKIQEYNKCKKVLEIGLLLNPDNNDGKFILSKIEAAEKRGLKPLANKLGFNFRKSFKGFLFSSICWG